MARVSIASEVVRRRVVFGIPDTAAGRVVAELELRWAWGVIKSPRSMGWRNASTSVSLAGISSVTRYNLSAWRLGEVSR